MKSLTKKGKPFGSVPVIDEQHSPVTYNFVFLRELEPNALRFYFIG